MGNGILTCIDEKTHFQDFFSDNEIITYKNEIDLMDKLIQIKDDKNNLIKRSKLAKKNYFRYFENTIVAEYMMNKIFGSKTKYKYIWEK